MAVSCFIIPSYPLLPIRMCSENSQSLAFPRCSVPGWPTFAPCPWKLYPLRPSTPFTCPEGSTWPPTPQRHGIYIVTFFYCFITWVPQEADSIMKVKVWESVLGINTCGREGHQDWTEGEGGLWCSPNKASADPIGSSEAEMPFKVVPSCSERDRALRPLPHLSLDMGHLERGLDLG